MNFFVKGTQRGGDRLPFKCRQSDARACSGNRSSTQGYWRGAEKERPEPTCAGSRGGVAVAVAVAVVRGLAGVRGLLEGVDV